MASQQEIYVYIHAGHRLSCPGVRFATRPARRSEAGVMMMLRCGRCAKCHHATSQVHHVDPLVQASRDDHLLASSVRQTPRIVFVAPDRDIGWPCGTEPSERLYCLPQGLYWNDTARFAFDSPDTHRRVIRAGDHCTRAQVKALRCEGKPNAPVSPLCVTITSLTQSAWPSADATQVGDP